MYRLCIGIFLNIMRQTKNNDVNQNDFLTNLLSISSKDDYLFDDGGYQGKFLKYNLDATSELITSLKTNKNNLYYNFNKRVLPLINVKYKEKAVFVLKDIIIKDDDIYDSDVIGFDNLYTKSYIKSNNQYNFTHFIVNIFYYVACILSKNKMYKSINESFPKDYLNTINDDYKIITFNDKLNISTKEINTTIKEKDFNNVFKEIYHNEKIINDRNQNTLNIYQLDIVNHKFDYKKIKKFIKNNISNYVFSRIQHETYIKNEEIENLTYDAVKKVKLESCNYFSEIMIYSFLECVLKAPKIFTKFELNHSHSSGIHFIRFELNGSYVSQLIFCATETTNKFNDSINKVFEQINRIDNNIDEEFELLSPTLLQQNFDDKMSNYIQRLIIPNENNSDDIENAYGIFIGYSFNTDVNTELLTKDEITNQLLIDVSEIKSLIENKIKLLNLNNKTFYVYVLPLNNALTDKDEIMRSILGGD